MAPPARRPRLLVLSQLYSPEPNFISADIAASMSRHFDVTVVAAHPNHPLGRFYEGHRWWWPVRTREGSATVWRLPMYPYHGRSQALRAVSYLSFAFLAALFAPFVSPRPDVVWVYQTPFTTALAALWFRYVLRARLVFTCADLWPESFVAAGVTKPGRLMRILFAYRRAINRAAHVVVCSTIGTRDRFVADGLPESVLPVIPVWVDGAGERSVEGEAATEPRHIIYAGNLGLAQSLEGVVEAAALAERDALPVVFDFYGSGSSEDSLRRLTATLGARNVHFHGAVSPQEAFAVSSRAFAQIVSLQPTPLFAMTVPSKLAFCCSAGAPILYGLQGEAAAIVKQAGGGIPFDPADPKTLVAAVKDLLARPDDERRRLRESLQHYYDEHLATSKLLARYEEIFLSVGAATTATPARDRLATGGRHAR